MLRLFRRSRTQPTIERLYGAIVAQARQPAFYSDLAVPDTVMGRLEMVMLHTFLICHRLKDGGETEKAIAQDVFDRFVEDMDSALREMGIGDLSVPKKMKKIGEAFYGRTQVYDAALDAPPPALEAALARNVMERDGAEIGLQVKALADYVRAAAAQLAATASARFAAGDIAFPPPPAAPRAPEPMTPTGARGDA